MAVADGALPRRLAALRLRASDAVFVVAAGAVVLVGMWVRHGGLRLLCSAQADLTAAGELTALLGTYAALVQIVLMSRSPWLENSFGMDRLAHWHRWLGFSCVTLISAHVVLSTVGYALGDGSGVAQEFATLVTTYPFMLMATVATGLLVGIAVTSLRWARRHLRYETWHFVHLYTYLALALAFGHELAVGTDLARDPVARDYWIFLYVVVAACVIAFRVVAPLRLTLRHHLVVSRVVEEAPGVTSLYLNGRDLDRLPGRAGQFYKWRFLAGDGWWRSQPFSLSTAPNGRYLRITARRVGDGTRQLSKLRPGTRVALEGPYGIFTSDRRCGEGTVLIAGGIGVTPLRALLEELAPTGERLWVLYAARRWEDVVFRKEIDEIVGRAGGEVAYLIGAHENADSTHDPLSPEALNRLVPEMARRDVFVCGPEAMMRHVETSLLRLGLPRRQLHRERFSVLA